MYVITTRFTTANASSSAATMNSAGAVMPASTGDLIAITTAASKTFSGFVVM